MTLSKREIARRISALESAGLKIYRVEITPEGSMVIDTAPPEGGTVFGESDDGSYKKWKEKAAKRA